MKDLEIQDLEDLLSYINISEEYKLKAIEDIRKYFNAVYTITNPQWMIWLANLVSSRDIWDIKLQYEGKTYQLYARWAYKYQAKISARNKARRDKQDIIVTPNHPLTPTKWLTWQPV